VQISTALLSELLAKRYCICDAKKTFPKDSGLEPRKRGRNAIDITSMVCTESASNSKIKVYARKVTKCNNIVYVEGLIAFDKYVFNFWFFGYLLDK
jgi:RNase P/RNase MRP subunit p30